MQGPTSLFHARDRLQDTRPRPRFHTPRHAYLFLQPVVVLHDASHDDIRSLHVKRNLPSRFILEGGPGGMNTQEEHLVPLQWPLPTRDAAQSVLSGRQCFLTWPKMKSERGASLWGKGHRKQENSKHLENH